MKLIVKLALEKTSLVEFNLCTECTSGYCYLTDLCETIIFSLYVLVPDKIIYSVSHRFVSSPACPDMPELRLAQVFRHIETWNWTAYAVRRGSNGLPFKNTEVNPADSNRAPLWCIWISYTSASFEWSHRIFKILRIKPITHNYGRHSSVDRGQFSRVK